ncbi:hypothetical protein [Kineococcus indalonis]|uniref:hypothetical protein n=1 Tax=Kineococcus indalonis TaxID=2696566 RepID=UPI0014136740|nr:hypothetical protein [Kineococcus indalonis]NAZ88232.1 hypothetical protein [Kineococcus indalonis]
MVPAAAATPARGLARPTVVDWLEEVAGVVGPQRALLAWSGAARATGLHGMALTTEQMRVVGERVAADATDPRLRLAVRSCLLRLRVHAALETTEGARR